MKVLAPLTTLALLATASSGFANCSDTFVADCGSFQVLSTICMNPTTGEASSSSYTAVFKDEKIKSIPFIPVRTLKKGVETYRAPTTSDSDILLELTVDSKGDSTFSHSMSIWGKRGTPEKCQSIDRYPN